MLRFLLVIAIIIAVEYYYNGTKVQYITLEMKYGLQAVLFICLTMMYSEKVSVIKSMSSVYS